MNIHRVGAGVSSDYQNIPPAERNIFQRVAAGTYGIVAPANAISLIGAGLTVRGLQQVVRGEYTRGVINIGVGRGFDIGDGIVAEITGTKSTVGAALDGGLDTLLAFYAAHLLGKHDILPAGYMQAITLEKTIDVVAVGATQLLGARPNTSPIAKYGGVALWGGVMVGIGYHMYEESGDNEELRQVLNVANHVAQLGSVTLRGMASVGYVQDMLTALQFHAETETA